MHLFFDYHPDRDVIVYCLSDERLLCLEKGEAALGSEQFVALISEYPIVSYDVEPFFLRLRALNFPKRFSCFDLKRLFRAYYGVAEDIPYEEAKTQFDDQTLLQGCEAFSFFVHLCDFEAEDAACLLGVDYGDCLLSFPECGEAFAWLNLFKQAREERISAFDPKRIKRLLFFDLECANTDGNIGKICEFGGVYASLSMQIEGEIEMLINPESTFKVNRLGRGLQLFYRSADYERSPSFPQQYDRLKSVLEDEETLLVGFASGNDFRFLMGDCWRYRLPGFDLLGLDVQPLADRLLGSKRSLSLEDALFGLGGSLPNGLTPHRALDDAKLTLLVAQQAFQRVKGGLLGYLENKSEGFITSLHVDKILEHPLPKLRYWSD